eukprot:6713252-Prymnesium_polylepis.4
MHTPRRRSSSAKRLAMDSDPHHVPTLRAGAGQACLPPLQVATDHRHRLGRSCSSSGHMRS